MNSKLGLVIDDDVRFQRTMDFFSHKKLAAMNFHIVGAGAIGSNTALYLAKMGARQICIWDNDEFEEHNLPIQICRVQDIGKMKVEAVADIIKDFEGIEIEQVEDLFDGEIEPNSIIISAVDSMKSRKEIWDLVKKQPLAAIIDGRMGLTSMNVYTACFDCPEMVKYYESTLWDDSETVELRCTAKATIFTAGTIASIICNIVSKMLRKKDIPCEVMMEMDDMYTKVVDSNGKTVSETQFKEDF